MANEFVARKGLIVLANGAKITGSLDVSGSVSSSVGFSGSGANVFDVDFNLLANKPTLISSSTQFTDLSGAFTGSFTGSFSGDGSNLTGIATVLTISGSTGSDSINLKTEALTITGSGGVTATVTDNTVTIGVTGGFVSSSGQLDLNDLTGTLNVNKGGTGQTTLTSGAVLLGNGTDPVASVTREDITGDTKIIVTGGVGAALTATSLSLGGGVVTASSQIDVRNTTGIETIATTGSNTFTGVQTISNTTNSTDHTNGALIVQGGVGIAKDVNISGSLTVVGLLTAVSMSTQYVTSSQYVVGTSRIILNDDDLVRFGGMTVIDSGSTPASGSILWDSLYNHFIIETDDIHNGNVDPHSAILIAGPETYEDVGNEIGLVAGRVPVATSDHNIDNRLESSSIRVDFPSRLTHIEAGLYITGAVSSSVGFSGDGSNLTGIVTNLNITGSQGGTGSVSLKTQGLTVSGSNGVAVTVNNQTILISGSNATTSSIGVASFNGNNFTVVDGQVSAKPAVVNGVNVELGSSINISLAEITSASALTPDQLLLNGGAIIHGVLYTSGSNLDVDTGTEVIATFPTASYDAAHFDYVIKKAANRRTGTVMVVWEPGTSNVEFTDTSTNDLGDTTEAVFTADILSGNIRLLATVSTTDWAVKTAARFI
jgi:hypothetical protein